jgi:hypothetical protein
VPHSGDDDTREWRERQRREEVPAGQDEGRRAEGRDSGNGTGYSGGLFSFLLTSEYCSMDWIF